MKKVSGEDLKAVFDAAKAEAIAHARTWDTSDIHRAHKRVSKVEGETSEREPLAKMRLTGTKHGLGYVLLERLVPERLETHEEPCVEDIVRLWRWRKLLRPRPRRSKPPAL